MKKVVTALLFVMLLCVFIGCSTAEADDPMVGQWKYENADYWYLFLANGDAFEISCNVSGDYITTVNVYKEGTYDVREDGSYTAYDSWYKENGEYYHKTILGGGRVESIHLDGDTLVFGDSVYEWYRVPKKDMIPLNKIYYFTYDLENVEYVSHPLDELLDGGDGK